MKAIADLCRISFNKPFQEIIRHECVGVRDVGGTVVTIHFPIASAKVSKFLAAADNEYIAIQIRGKRTGPRRFDERKTAR